MSTVSFLLYQYFLFLTQKGFVEVSKNLAKCSSENNFVEHQNNYVADC